MIKPLRIGQRPFELIARELDALLRDVVERLNRPVPTLSCVIDTGALPVTIALPANVRPRGLRLLRAVVQDGETVISGGAITWDARAAGVVRVHSLGALAASTRYDATIAVEE